MWWFVGSFVPWIACDHKQNRICESTSQIYFVIAIFAKYTTIVLDCKQMWDYEEGE